jgi:FRG domain
LERFPLADLYRYMVYLRHHGFPSPLLDWSRSRYVAGFFAFREPVPADGHRSIYVYCEMPRGMKGGAVGEPTIRHMGPYVRSHRRHFRQQSDYTICGNFNDGAWSYHPHEEVFGNRQADILWKFNVPSAERLKVLQILDEYNLNAFSLFDSEETLLETMWFRERILRGFKNQKSGG